ncbi:hypothetical protein [Bradyrhizobium sp. LA6.12]|uniref:hypothetical protein n=1 Tax=unclassified Bradyrhizobium TaxID=2631580 RepID=UPI0033916AB1
MKGKGSRDTERDGNGGGPPFSGVATECHLLNEASHQLPPQNHERILANQQRFHTARVNRVTLGACRSLPVYTCERTLLDRSGMSQTGQEQLESASRSRLAACTTCSNLTIARLVPPKLHRGSAMLEKIDAPHDRTEKPDYSFSKFKSWFFRSPRTLKNADDCLPSDALNQLRAEVVGRPLSDDVAEMISAAFGVGERIRSRKMYIEAALQRLQFVVSCALQEKPQLVLARDELLRIQLEISQNSGYIGGRIARLSGGSSTVMVLAALLASLLLWGLAVVGVRLLLDGLVLDFFRFRLQLTSGLVSDLFKNVFFMDQRALLVIVSAAFLGGVVSIATRLGEFAKVRGLDPFAMFWTAMLKPLIGVTLSVFILAALSGEIVGLGLLGKDPLGLVKNDQAIAIGDAGTLSAKTAYILWVIGFLAGFSERFASDFVQRTEGIAGGNVVGDKPTT